jgi:hypothetical protein
VAIVDGNRVIPGDRKKRNALYRLSVRLLIKRLNNGSSFRKLGKILGLSHTTLEKIFDNPSRVVSIKTQKKIIMRILRRKSFVKKKIERGGIGIWNKDTF